MLIEILYLRLNTTHRQSCQADRTIGI